MISFPSLIVRLIRTSEGIYPGAAFKEKLNRIKYIFRGVWHAKDTRELMEILAHPELESLCQTYPRLVAKLQWPFISCRYRNRQKNHALRDHYTFFVNDLPQAIRTCISLGQIWPLATLASDENECVGLVLRQANYEKEGELAISVVSLTTQEQICTATFTLVKYSPSEREIMIGGLQGHEFADNKSRIIRITRNLKGLRPKSLLLFAIQRVAMCWNCRSVRAVGNELHIYNSNRKRKDLAADYDAFWTESGGIREKDGFFTLPVVPPVRNISDLKPNKRSTYRQRYSLLEDVAEQICASLAGKSDDKGDEAYIEKPAAQ